MSNEKKVKQLMSQLASRPRAGLAQLPTPIHQLHNFGEQLGGPELWIKRDDLTGLEGGGNKTRKLEFLVGDAIEKGADMLVTAGAIQSNHTRQTAAAAAKYNLKCALLHFGWTEDAGPAYRQVGNALLSSIMGAEMFLDDTERPIEDQSPLLDFCEYQRNLGHIPYLIPAGASEHRLGSLGYLGCAAEIVRQCKEQDVYFDYIVHCTGSSSTQAGLLAGFAACARHRADAGDADAALAVGPELLALLEGAATHMERRLVRLQAELEGREAPGPLRAIGDLILARYSEIPAGAETIDLTDFAGEGVTVELDPRQGVRPTLTAHAR